MKTERSTWTTVSIELKEVQHLLKKDSTTFRHILDVGYGVFIPLEFEKVKGMAKPGKGYAWQDTSISDDRTQLELSFDK